MNEILNFHQSTETIGTAGQPTAAQFQQIAEQGYSSVINLAMPDSDNAIAEEGSIVSSLGMSYIHLPVPFESPSAEHLSRFIRIMDALDGDKVFVHCALNMRVSAFMYKYLILRTSCSEAAATSPILALWLPQMGDAWQSILDLDPDEIGK